MSTIHKFKSVFFALAMVFCWVSFINISPAQAQSFTDMTYRAGNTSYPLSAGSINTLPFGFGIIGIGYGSNDDEWSIGLRYGRIRLDGSIEHVGYAESRSNTDLCSGGQGATCSAPGPGNFWSNCPGGTSCSGGRAEKTERITLFDSPAPGVADEFAAGWSWGAETDQECAYQFYAQMVPNPSTGYYEWGPETYFGGTYSSVCGGGDNTPDRRGWLGINSIPGARNSFVTGITFGLDDDASIEVIAVTGRRLSAPAGNITVSSVDINTGAPVNASWQFLSFPVTNPCSSPSACRGTSRNYSNMPQGYYSLNALSAPPGCSGTGCYRNPLITDQNGNILFAAGQMVEAGNTSEFVIRWTPPQVVTPPTPQACPSSASCSQGPGYSETRTVTESCCGGDVKTSSACTNYQVVETAVGCSDANACGPRPYNCNPYDCNPQDEQYVCGSEQFGCAAYQFGVCIAPLYRPVFCTRTVYDTCYDTCTDYYPEGSVTYEEIVACIPPLKASETGEGVTTVAKTNYPRPSQAETFTASGGGPDAGGPITNPGKYDWDIPSSCGVLTTSPSQPYVSPSQGNTSNRTSIQVGCDYPVSSYEIKVENTARISNKNYRQEAICPFCVECENAAPQVEEAVVCKFGDADKETDGNDDGVTAFCTSGVNRGGVKLEARVHDSDIIFDDLKPSASDDVRGTAQRCIGGDCRPTSCTWEVFLQKDLVDPDKPGPGERSIYDVFCAPGGSSEQRKYCFSENNEFCGFDSNGDVVSKFTWDKFGSYTARFTFDDGYVDTGSCPATGNSSQKFVVLPQFKETVSYNFASFEGLGSVEGVFGRISSALRQLMGL